MARNGDNFQLIGTAGKYIPLPHGMQNDSAVYHGPVFFHRPAFSKFFQTFGVIPVSMGQQHLYRKICNLLYCLKHLAVRKTSVN